MWSLIIQQWTRSSLELLQDLLESSNPPPTINTRFKVFSFLSFYLFAALEVQRGPLEDHPVGIDFLQR